MVTFLDSSTSTVTGFTELLNSGAVPSEVAMIAKLGTVQHKNLGRNLEGVFALSEIEGIIVPFFECSEGPVTDVEEFLKLFRFTGGTISN